MIKIIDPDKLSLVLARRALREHTWGKRRQTIEDAWRIVEAADGCVREADVHETVWRKAKDWGLR